MSYFSNTEDPLSRQGLGCGPQCNCGPCKSGLNGLDEWYEKEEDEEPQRPTPPPAPVRRRLPPPGRLSGWARPGRRKRSRGPTTRDMRGSGFDSYGNTEDNMAYIRQRPPNSGFGWPAGMRGLGEPQPSSYYYEVGDFDFDKADLSPAQQAKIAYLADQLIQFNIRKVKLVGHTDPVGSAQYNKGLGQRRADMVRKALIAAIESKRPGLTRSVVITADSAGEMQQASGRSPSGQRRVAVDFFLEPPPPPPPPPPSREYKLPPDYRPPPSMGPPKYRIDECPENDICNETRQFLLDLQRKKVMLSQEDADRALDLEQSLLRRNRQPPLIVDPRDGWKLAKWVMEMRQAAYNRLRKFASTVSWMPIPRQ